MGIGMRLLETFGAMRVRDLELRVLFRKVRPGLHGKPFVIYKFRTMREAYDDKPLGELLRLVGQLSDQEQLELIAQLSRRLANKVGFPFATPNLDGNVGFRS